MTTERGNSRLANPQELAEFIRNFPSDPEVMARVRKQLAEHVPAKRRLPDGTLEKTREELEAEIEELRREKERLRALIDYVKDTCMGLAESYRSIAEVGADRGSSLEYESYGMALAYETAADMLGQEGDDAL